MRASVMSKRADRGSSNSSPEQKPKEKQSKTSMADCERDMTKESTKMILDSIQVLRDEVNSGINKLQTDMDIRNAKRPGIHSRDREIVRIRVGQARRVIGTPRGP